MQKEDYIDKEGNMIEDVNNNEDLNHIYGSIDQVTTPINSDIEDPDYTVNENSGGSSGTHSEDHLLKPKEHNPSFIGNKAALLQLYPMMDLAQKRWGKSMLQ